MTATGRPLLLAALGLLIEATCLFWGVCATAHSAPDPWVLRFEAPIKSGLQTVLGPIRQDDPPRTWERVKISQLLGGFAVAFAAYVLAVALVLRGPPLDRREIWLVLGLSGLFRLTLVPAPPMLETDMHRYVWDGAVSAAGINPYRYAPSEATVLDDPVRARLSRPGDQADLMTLARLAALTSLRPHFLRINHKEIPTIYPPLAQALFAGAARIALGSQVVVKALVALIDMVLVVAVWQVLCELGKSPGQILIYAWCPLILREFAGTGHYDPLAMLLTLLGLLALACRRRAMAGALLGLGVATKLYPAVVAVLLAVELGPMGILACILTVLALYVPYLSAGIHLFDGLTAFATSWEFNAGLFALAERGIAHLAAPFTRAGYVLNLIVSSSSPPGTIVGSAEIAVDAFFLTKVAAVTAVLVFLIALRRSAPRGPAETFGLAMAAVGAVVLASPVIDPWYFCWVMPFAAIFPAASWIYLSGGMILHYLYFWTWDYPWWTRPVEYVPFFLLLLSEHRAVIAAIGALARPRRG